MAILGSIQCATLDSNSNSRGQPFLISKKTNRGEYSPYDASVEQNGIENVFTKLVKQLGNPMEFELPDWFNKWQSAPYLFIKRNIYLTKKPKRRHEDDGIFCSCNQSTGNSPVCGRDCHCGMLLSSCSSGCKCGDACINKPFQNRPIKKMKLVQTEKCGSGIVADEDIKQGEFIIEYVGEGDDFILFEVIYTFNFFFNLHINFMVSSYVLRTG
ncbi:hypothetical protein Cgig2_004504 [Carnegiea gigantea]|uniref:AWS domain-containing protein n=1 Tax=Carnegiea gigantea TaxID=171969 RepID=A0A9Q1K7M9_9CARY|nr:hypothetical protein Cgig2_004504 [Carnegiea gigantea]